MRQLKGWFAYLIAAGVGLAIWIVLPLVTGEPEAWNSSLYYKVAIPALTIICGILGFTVPDRWWHWGFVVTSAQVSFMVAKWPTSNLLPPAVVFLLLLSIPYFVSSFLGSRIAGYWNRKSKKR